MLIKNLFILDDDIITTYMMGEILKDISFVEKFHIENNGWQALEYLQNIPSENAFPDVLLIDLKMPEMDGFEFIEHYEQYFHTIHPASTIAVITSSISENDRKLALSYKSVSKFLLKPFNEQVLEDIARERIRLIN